LFEWAFLPFHSVTSLNTALPEAIFWRFMDKIVCGHRFQWQGVFAPLRSTMGVPVAVGFLLISEHYRMDENEGRAAESAAVDLVNTCLVA